jgi:hypothetical protein
MSAGDWIQAAVGVLILATLVHAVREGTRTRLRESRFAAVRLRDDLVAHVDKNTGAGPNRRRAVEIHKDAWTMRVREERPWLYPSHGLEPRINWYTDRLECAVKSMAMRQDLLWISAAMDVSAQSEKLAEELVAYIRWRWRPWRRRPPLLRLKELEDPCPDGYPHQGPAIVIRDEMDTNE